MKNVRKYYKDKKKNKPINLKNRNKKSERIKIFIDQGHNPTGFHNVGSSGNGLYEQDITYEVGKTLQSIFEKDSRFEVIVSRPQSSTALGNDNRTSLQERTSKANTWMADYFISIHTNASNSKKANGTECYVFSENSDIYNLASLILESISSNLNTKKRGVKSNKELFVLKHTLMPAVLIELAFITNYEDSQKLKQNQKEFAKSIYDGVLKYLDLDNVIET